MDLGCGRLINTTQKKKHDKGGGAVCNLGMPGVVMGLNMMRRKEMGVSRREA